MMNVKETAMDVFKAKIRTGKYDHYDGEMLLLLFTDCMKEAAFSASTLEAGILNYMGSTQDGKISRPMLRRYTNKTDRDGRDKIRDLRCDGENVIISTSDKEGYRLPKNLSEVRHFVNEVDNRAENTSKAADSARELLSLIDGILSKQKAG